MTDNKNQEDIAIVGMSCLFPGADGIDEFWRNICNKNVTTQDAPEEWGAGRYCGPTGNDRVSTPAGGFLGDLYRFDPVELGVMPSSIDGGEPDQMLALRIAKEALADAGYLDDAFDHSKTGIILGHSTYLHRGNANVVQHGIVIDQTVALLQHLFPQLDADGSERVRSVLKNNLPQFNSDMAAGLVPNVMTGRIANKLNFRGPNYLLDAACASSLLTVMAATEELRAGRSDMMLAGGVNAALPAEVSMVFTQLDALSASSQVRPFSSQADGTLLGEGLGIIVLKRLADAKRDNDRIYSVIKAVGQSSDGKGLGLLAPNVEGEVLAMRRAYDQAGIPPDSIGLVEAHGTGIPLGDQTEISALGQIFGARDAQVPPIAIGSVKSLIGHCIPAAGVAGIIKTALALYHKVLPPTVCEEVSAELGIETTPLYVNTSARPWVHPMGASRRAGVNAFGFGGVNTHAVMEEPPQDTGAGAQPGSWTKELILLSANSRDEMIRELDVLINRIRAGDFAAASLAEFAMGMAIRPSAGPVKLAIITDKLSDVADKIETARKRLEEGARNIQARSGIFFADEPIGGKLAFVFPGEGAQYQGMLEDVLIAFPEAREWFDFWDTLLPDQRIYSPSQCVFPPPTTLDAATSEALHNQLFGLELGSESVFIASQALLATLNRLELKADVVTGHSGGENSALFAAGVVGADGWEGLRQRIRDLNRIYREIESSKELTDGALLTVGAVARERILEHVDGKELYLALDNCNHQSVLFGSKAVVEKAASEFSKMGGLCSFLPIDRPYHTPLFAPVAVGIEFLYETMEFRQPSLPIYSCASAAPMTGQPCEIRRSAAAQWCSRVRFTETVERMYEDGVRIFVEVGPSSNLTGFIGDILKDKPYLSIALDNRRRSSLTEFLHGLGRLWVLGRDFSVPALFEGRNLTPVDIEAGAPRNSRNRLYPNTLPYISFSADDVSEIRGAIGQSPDGAVANEVAGGPAEERVTEQDGRISASTGDAELSDNAAMLPDQYLVTPDQPTGQGPYVEDAFEPYELVDEPGAQSDFPFLHEIVECDDDRLTAHCHLSTEQDAFLRHHVLYTSDVSELDPGLHGLAVVPLSVSLEMLTEAAAYLAHKPYVVRLENVRAYNWIALDDGVADLVLRVSRSATGQDEEIFAASIIRDDVRVFEADVVFADEPHPSQPSIPELVDPRAPTWSDDALYTSGMFHGPLFQSIRSLIAWDDTGLDAELNDTFLDGFFEYGRYPGLILNPVLLDAIGHVTAFWIAQGKGTDFSSFPSSIDRIDLPGASFEETGGSVLRGRVSVQNEEDGSYLAGNYECVNPDGDVLFRASGWRDRFFDVPHRFYFARYKPLEGWYGEDCSDLFQRLREDCSVWFVPAFPDGFLENAGAIWKRVLAHTVLSAEERTQWAALSPNVSRRTDRLMSRVALKEVARNWIERTQGISLYPADLIVRVGNSGKPYIAQDGLDGIQWVPEVSLAHTKGNAIAAAAAPGSAVGIDFEFLNSIDSAESIRSAFTENDMKLIGDDQSRLDRILYAWCAKEASAKCLGEGLNGRPQAFELQEFGADNNNARVLGLGKELGVSFGRRGDAVMALACPSPSGPKL